MRYVRDWSYCPRAYLRPTVLRAMCLRLTCRPGWLATQKTWSRPAYPGTRNISFSIVWDCPFGPKHFHLKSQNFGTEHQGYSRPRENQNHAIRWIFKLRIKPRREISYHLEFFELPDSSLYSKLLPRGRTLSLSPTNANDLIFGKSRENEEPLSPILFFSPFFLSFFLPPPKFGPTWSSGMFSFPYVTPSLVHYS